MICLAHTNAWTRPFALLFIAFSCCFSPSAQSFMNNPQGRQITSLNGKWQVIVDPYNRGLAAKFFQDRKPEKNTDFVEYGFDKQTLHVPGDWNYQDPHLYFYEGSVWYKKEFTAKLEQGKRAFLYFGGANYLTTVYLNGKKIGSHEGGFTPFQFEVTAALVTGDNKLIVSVNNQRKEDAIPALNYDWWNYGGITRDVSLIETPESFVDKYFIQLKKGSLNKIEGWVHINGGNRKSITLMIPKAGISKQLMPDTSGTAYFTAEANNLHLWSPKDPFRYDINISTPSENISEKIGFRSIEVKGLDILLNGNPVFLKGVCLHEEFAPQERRAVSVQDAKQLLQSAKDLGCNFIRTAHYPQNEHIVEMAEAMGLMIWEEIPVWQNIQFSNPIILAKTNTLLQEMVERDRNRCAVIVWSLSNETAPAPDRDRVLTNMAASCRAMDNTRLVSSAFDHVKIDGNKTIIEDTLAKVLDVIGINRYMGWYKAWPAEPGTMTFESVFNKPMIMTEFGCEAKYGNHGAANVAGLWNEEFQEKLYQDNIAMLKNIPFLRGVSPWVLYDFRSPTRLNPQTQEGWNRKGLLSNKGEKKKAWYVMKAYYDSIQ